MFKKLQAVFLIITSPAIKAKSNLFRFIFFFKQYKFTLPAAV